MACPTSAIARHAASSPALRMSAAQHASEDMYPQMLDKASLCAHSDTCSVEISGLYLKEIVHVQSGCAAGTFSGSNSCTDVLRVSKVLSDLRAKIGWGATTDVR